LGIGVKFHSNSEKIEVGLTENFVRLAKTGIKKVGLADFENKKC